MSNAVQTGEVSTISALLEKTRTLQVINAWIRDYPELMYVGMYLPNMFTDWGKMKTQLTYAEQKAISFKSIGALEATMSVNANEVVWYEAGLYLEEAEITADNTADNTIVVDAASIKFFKVGDVVVVKPGLWSSTAEVQAEITAINTSTNTITLDTAVTALAGDRLVFAYNLITYWTEISRGVAESDVTPVKTYFQTFGESMEFDSNEINQTRLLVDAKEYVKGKFSVAINSANNRFAKAFYLGRNVAGTRSETQGLEAVVQEIEARDGAGSAIVSFSGITDTKAKAKKLVETINKFATAPVYMGGEVPTIYVNDTFISKLSEIMFDMANYMTLKEKDIEFGLQSYSSPFFRNVQFIVSHTLNRLEPFKSVAYIFPKHLVTFKTPQYQSVNEQGALVTNKVGWYTVMKMPQVSPDKVKYTAQMRIANVFAGQSFKNSYGRITWF